MLYSGFLLIIFPLLDINSCVCDDSKSLRLANVVFRHGDRSPIRAYPKDPFQEDSWPQGFGQLTQKGIEHEYMLGLFLRKRYIESGFLSTTYLKSKVYVRSTDMDRTLMSAYTVLAGLYPPDHNQTWHRNLTWQPIPVHSVPLVQDYLLSNDAVCPACKDLVLQWEANSTTMKELRTRYKTLAEYVALHTGLNDTWDSMLPVLDTLYCEYNEGKFNDTTMAKWLSVNNTFHKLMSLRNVKASMYTTPGITRFRSGTLIRHLSENMTARADKDPKFTRDLILYSAHDSTVINLLSALKIFNNKQPSYCTAVLVELHQNISTQAYHVCIYLKEGYQTEQLTPLTLPGCSFWCPLKKFNSLIRSSILKDIRKECHLDRTNSKHQDKLVGVAILSSITVLLIAILTAVLVMLCKQRQRLGSYRPLPTNFDDDS